MQSVLTIIVGIRLRIEKNFPWHQLRGIAIRESIHLVRESAFGEAGFLLAVAAMKGFLKTLPKARSVNIPGAVQLAEELEILVHLSKMR